jgi:hypothetical protein
MKRVGQVVLVAAAIALGFWLWNHFFPSPEKVIRSRLQALAETVSFKAGEGNISKIYNFQKLPDYFTPDVTVIAEVRGYPSISVDGRDDLVQVMMATRQTLSWLNVQLVDINVTLSEDKQTAVANFTAKATASNQPDLFVQEFNFMLRKVDGRWLIYRIETVKTLS